MGLTKTFWVFDPVFTTRHLTIKRCPLEPICRPVDRAPKYTRITFVPPPEFVISRHAVISIASPTFAKVPPGIEYDMRVVSVVVEAGMPAATALEYRRPPPPPPPPPVTTTATCPDPSVETLLTPDPEKSTEVVEESMMVPEFFMMMDPLGLDVTVALTPELLGDDPCELTATMKYVNEAPVAMPVCT